MGARYQRALRCDEIDAKFGFDRFQGTTERMGWLLNMHPVGSLIILYFLYTLCHK